MMKITYNNYIVQEVRIFWKGEIIIGRDIFIGSWDDKGGLGLYERGVSDGIQIMIGRRLINIGMFKNRKTAVGAGVEK